MIQLIEFKIFQSEKNDASNGNFLVFNNTQEKFPNLYFW